MFIYKSRYFQLRYEDMIQTPERTLQNLYAKLGLALDLDSIASLNRHLTSPPDIVGKYMSTYQGPQNDINKWIQKLETETVANFEKHCSAAIIKYGYKLTTNNKD